MDKEALADFLTVITPAGKVKVSSLERQVAFKRYSLKSDIEGAEHLERVFKENIDLKKVEFYRRIIEEEAAKDAKTKTRQG